MKIKLNPNSEDKNTNKTLKSLTKLAEEQRELMSKLALGGSTKETSKISKQLLSTLSNPSIQDAFKTADLYSNTLKDFKKSLASQNISSMQKIFESTIPSYLKKDYGLAFKATDKWKKTEEQLKSLGLLKNQAKELTELSKSITGTTSPLDYAKEVSRATAGLSYSSFSEHMKNISKGIDTVDKANRTRGLHNNHMKIIRIQQEKTAKREQRVYENSERQVKLLKSIVEYMDTQSQNLSLQNEILSEQVENLQLQNNQTEEQITEIKKQNKLMQEQQEENRKSSKTALWTAIISIFLGAIVGIGGIYFSYLLYQWQDKSDNKNHSELLQVIQKTGSSKDLDPLIQEQIKTSTKTNQLLEEFLKQNQQKITKLPTKKPTKIKQ